MNKIFVHILFFEDYRQFRKTMVTKIYDFLIETTHCSFLQVNILIK